MSTLLYIAWLVWSGFVLLLVFLVALEWAAFILLTLMGEDVRRTLYENTMITEAMKLKLDLYENGTAHRGLNAATFAVGVLAYFTFAL